MKNIRKEAFETNSSSSHSITINEDTKLFTSMKPDDNGIITLEGGEFGWEYEEYSDPWTKANYCALDAQGNEEKTIMLVKVIKEHTGAKEVVFNLEGYIDHQSVGTTHEAFESEEKLKAFLFSSSSYLVTDNDNH